MQMFLRIAAFSLRTDESGRPVLTQGKRPKYSDIFLNISKIPAFISLNNTAITEQSIRQYRKLNGVLVRCTIFF